MRAASVRRNRSAVCIRRRTPFAKPACRGSAPAMPSASATRPQSNPTTRTPVSEANSPSGKLAIICVSTTRSLLTRAAPPSSTSNFRASSPERPARCSRSYTRVTRAAACPILSPSPFTWTHTKIQSPTFLPVFTLIGSQNSSASADRSAIPPRSFQLKVPDTASLSAAPFFAAATCCPK